MSKLKNNFTTTEQSKRLLELGVPAWTADFFYPTKKSDMPIIIVDIKIDWNLKYAIPCWSVGRLIELLEIAVDALWSDYKVLDKSTLIERVLKDFEKLVKHKKMDFSKLEE